MDDVTRAYWEDVINATYCGFAHIYPLHLVFCMSIVLPESEEAKPRWLNPSALCHAVGCKNAYPTHTGYPACRQQRCSGVIPARGAVLQARQARAGYFIIH